MQLWKQRFATKLISAEEAVTHLKNGDRIYLGSMCSESRTIIRAMGNSRLSDIVMLQFLTGKEAASLAAKAPSRFNLRTFFPARRIDQSEHQSDADYVPLFHSQIPNFFRNRRIPIDVAIVQVSPPGQIRSLQSGSLCRHFLGRCGVRPDSHRSGESSYALDSGRHFHFRR